MWETWSKRRDRQVQKDTTTIQGVVVMATESRPWGHFETIVENQQSTVKLLYITEGKRTSLQYHQFREEQWYVVYGRVLVTLNGKDIIMNPGQRTTVPVKVPHRVKGLEDSIVLEVSSGHFDEKDIVRIQDDYQRV